MLNMIHLVFAGVTFFSLSYISYLNYVPPLANNISCFGSKSVEHLLPKFVNFSVKINDKVEHFVYKLYQPVEGGNLALILHKRCQSMKIKPQGNRIELVTWFTNISHPHYRKILGDLKHISNMTEDVTIQARLMEVVNALQLNLLHDMIETVHVLVWRRETALYLKSLSLRNSERLVIRVIDKEVGFKEQLEYASECLIGRVVAITNQDVTIGKGWDNDEYMRILKEKEIMYGLTSHSTANLNHGFNCTWTHKPLNNCGSGGDYRKSHDTFILHVRNWTSHRLEEMTDFTPSKIGMEKLFMWYFNSRLNFTMLNPCKILFVHHHHCVPIRSIKAPGVIYGERSSQMEFADNLE